MCIVHAHEAKRIEERTLDLLVRWLKPVIPVSYDVYCACAWGKKKRGTYVRLAGEVVKASYTGFHHVLGKTESSKCTHQLLVHQYSNVARHLRTHVRQITESVTEMDTEWIFTSLARKCVYETLWCVWNTMVWCVWNTMVCMKHYGMVCMKHYGMVCMKHYGVYGFQTAPSDIHTKNCIIWAKGLLSSIILLLYVAHNFVFFACFADKRHAPSGQNNFGTKKIAENYVEAAKFITLCKIVAENKSWTRNAIPVGVFLSDGREDVSHKEADGYWIRRVRICSDEVAHCSNITFTAEHVQYISTNTKCLW